MSNMYFQKAKKTPFFALTQVESRLVESEEVLGRANRILMETLERVAACYGSWSLSVIKEKMIFDALNKCEFDIKRHVFVAEGWVPKKGYEAVVRGLMEAATEFGLDTRPIVNRLKHRRLTPPTYIPTNRFTRGFQALVNTYGTPRYREANPGAFCCILFPYLFGIMFGDFGHGILLAIFGLWLIKKEKEWEGQKLSDMLEMIYGGRYILLLNGLFGAFVGICYNEAFAYPMAFFGPSHWKGADEHGHLGRHVCTADDHHCALAASTPYPWGVDPMWHYTNNKITFFNSLKMKISIVVGVIQVDTRVSRTHPRFPIRHTSHTSHFPYVTLPYATRPYVTRPYVTRPILPISQPISQPISKRMCVFVFLSQMTLGICLSLLNHIEYRDWKKVIFQFLPEMTFFMGIFGYLVFCILYKWSVDWNAGCGNDSNLFCEPAPSLLTLLINMFMSPTADIDTPLYGHQCFTDCASAADFCGTVKLIDDACPATCGTAIDAAHSTDTLQPMDANGLQTKVCFSQLQSKVQYVLLVAALVSVPLLLLPIPFIEMFQAKQARAKVNTQRDKDM